jgi:hypothetical protein
MPQRQSRKLPSRGASRFLGDFVFLPLLHLGWPMIRQAFAEKHVKISRTIVEINDLHKPMLK